MSERNVTGDEEKTNVKQCCKKDENKNIPVCCNIFLRWTKGKIKGGLNERWWVGCEISWECGYLGYALGHALGYALGYLDTLRHELYEKYEFAYLAKCEKSDLSKKSVKLVSSKSWSHWCCTIDSGAKLALFWKTTCITLDWEFLQKSIFAIAVWKRPCHVQVIFGKKTSNYTIVNFAKLWWNQVTGVWSGCLECHIF